MPLNAKGKNLIRQITLQHGLKFHGLSENGILHYSLTNKARMKAFKSTLRKYKLHYRAEKTQESEETGVLTMKIRTDRDHKLMKLRRKQQKINKKPAHKKSKRPSKAIGLIMSGLKTAARPSDIKEELSLSSSDWKKLEKAGFTSFLHMTVPLILEYQDLLDECQWFFDQLHEHELSDKFDAGLSQIHDLIDILSIRLRSDDDLESLKQDLYVIYDEISGLYKLLLNICRLLVSKLSTVTKRPVSAFVQELSPYWNSITDVWTRYKDVLIPDWQSYLNEMSKHLGLLSEEVSVAKESSIHKLISVQQVLRKSTQYRMAEDLAALIDSSKEETLASGQVPAAMTATGGWVVYKDLCPNPLLPERNTKVSEVFAYCKVKSEGKKCPAFRGVHGEHVLCTEAGTYREGAFFSVISELKDPEVLEQLKLIAREDHQVLLIFKMAEARDNELFYARVSDDRIRSVLERYPSSKRVGTHSYIVYHVAGEPVMLTSDIAISADKSLLEELDKGTPMSKVATVRTAALLRLTFTGNARRDVNFIDYLRKLNAVKFSPNTWDIPFKLEADKERILQELKNDLGYPIQVFQIVESPDKTLAPWKYDVYAMTVVAKTKKVDSLNYSLEPSKLTLSDKLFDIAAQVKDNNELLSLASSLRVNACYVVVPQEDVSLVDGFYQVKHAEGTRLLTESGSIVELFSGEFRDIKTGELVSTKLAYIPSETAPDSPAMVIKITQDAIPALLNMLGIPVPAPMMPEPMAPPAFVPPPPPEPMEAPEPEGPSAPVCPCQNENTEPPTPEGKFVTFSPYGGESRPKITFLTPEASKKRK